MYTQDDVINQARTWLDVPYKHLGRKKNIAVDCAGLVIGVAREMKVLDPEDFRYSEFPDKDYLLRCVGDYLHMDASIASDPDILQQVAKGKVVVMYVRNPAEAQHMGIISENKGRLTLIHAFSKRGRVVEHSLSSFWKKRIMGVYRYPGVQY